VKSGKKTGGAGQSAVSETQVRQSKEEKWDAVSSELTALLQGKGIRLHYPEVEVTKKQIHRLAYRFSINFSLVGVATVS
jgi:hypothetical protein